MLFRHAHEYSSVRRALFLDWFTQLWSNILNIKGWPSRVTIHIGPEPHSLKFMHKSRLCWWVCLPESRCIQLALKQRKTWVKCNKCPCHKGAPWLMQWTECCKSRRIHCSSAHTCGLFPVTDCNVLFSPLRKSVPSWSQWHILFLYNIDQYVCHHNLSLPQLGLDLHTFWRL